jgi:hypothetical protein
MSANSVQNELVAQTLVVHRRSDDTWHYEIHLAPDLDSNAPRTVLVTKDQAAYDFALAIEGNPAARVTATFHHAKRGSYRFRVLDSIVMGAAA